MPIKELHLNKVKIEHETVNKAILLFRVMILMPNRPELEGSPMSTLCELHQYRVAINIKRTKDRARLIFRRCLSQRLHHLLHARITLFLPALLNARPHH